MSSSDTPCVTGSRVSDRSANGKWRSTGGHPLSLHHPRSVQISAEQFRSDYYALDVAWNQGSTGRTPSAMHTTIERVCSETASSTAVATAVKCLAPVQMLVTYQAAK